MNDYDAKCYLTERLGIMDKLIVKLEHFSHDRLNPQINEILYLKSVQNLLSAFLQCQTMIEALKNDIE